MNRRLCFYSRKSGTHEIVVKRRDGGDVIALLHAGILHQCHVILRRAELGRMRIAILDVDEEGRFVIFLAIVHLIDLKPQKEASGL